MTSKSKIPPQKKPMGLIAVQEVLPGFEKYVQVLANGVVRQTVRKVPPDSKKG